jgi:hypothetical protein
MANMTLPTASEVKAIDDSAFTWDDLLDGTLSEAQGKVIKAVVEKMATGEVLNLVEPYAATGKTAKFVVDNATNQADLKIVTSDMFVDTFLTTSDYFSNTGNVSNVYKQDSGPTSEIVYNEAAEAISVKYFDPYTDPNADPILKMTITLADAVPTMTMNEIAGLDRTWPSNADVVTHDGTKIGSETGEGTFNPDVWIINPWTPNLGYPDLDVYNQTRNFATVFNKMETGEVMVVLNFHIPNVNTAFWAALNPMTLTGKEWTVENVLNSEDDNSGYWQACIVKKS